MQAIAQQRSRRDEAWAQEAAAMKHPCWQTAEIPILTPFALAMMAGFNPAAAQGRNARRVRSRASTQALRESLPHRRGRLKRAEFEHNPDILIT
jgi:hypothetical protein